MKTRTYYYTPIPNTNFRWTYMHTYSNLHIRKQTEMHADAYTQADDASTGRDSIICSRPRTQTNLRRRTDRHAACRQREAGIDLRAVKVAVFLAG